MDVSISKDLTAQPNLVSAIDNASRILKDELGSSATSVKASWSLSQDQKGRPVVDLMISDWTGVVGYRFSPEELSDQVHMRIRLHRLWGDLLQVRSHALLDGAWWQLQGQAGA